jgi:tRNA1(Val) A37 N6-methylase TrmN6
VSLALENAQSNGLTDRYAALCGSILDATLLSQVGGADGVIANPPYLPRGEASISAHPIKALANVESDAVLADWVAAAIRLLRPGGSATFIHRADRLPELLALMRDGFGGLAILPIQAKSEAAASRVIVRGSKGTRAPATLLAPLVLHAPDGTYTAVVEAVLRHAAALAM